MKRAHNYKTERNVEIYNRRKAGETFDALAKSFGINRTRVKQVFRKEESIRAYGRDYLGWVERNGKCR